MSRGALQAMLRVCRGESRLPKFMADARSRMNFNEYRQFGLRRDDFWLDVENPLIEEAVRRLRPSVRERRNWRHFRAIDISTKRAILAKENWTTEEEDNDHYLVPMLEIINKEEADRELFDNQ